MTLTRVSPDNTCLPQVDGNTLSRISNSVTNDQILTHDQLKEYYTGLIYLIEHNKDIPKFYNYNVLNRSFSTASMFVCCIPCCMTKVLMIPFKCCCWKNKCVDCMDECSGACIEETCDRTWSTKKIDFTKMKTMPVEVICALVYKLILIIKSPKNDKQLYNAMVVLSNIYERKIVGVFIDVRHGKDPEIVSKILSKFANLPGFTEHWRMNYNNSIMM